MIIDSKINVNPVKPVQETQTAQLNADKTPDVSFEKLLRMTIAQNQRDAKRDADKKRDEQKTNTPTPREAEYHSATMMASYTMLDQIMHAQNRQEKEKQMARADDERTL